jgi:glucose uptake protein
MFIPQSYSLAISLCFITMLCWGSWANTQKLASKNWPFQLFYWDYVIGIVIMSLFIGLTLGSYGSSGRSFIVDLKQANIGSYLSAALGGFIFNLANILISAAINISGMSVAFPVGIGLALVIGIIVNYIATPVGNPMFLLFGVLFIVLAILLDAIAYSKLSNQNNETPKRGILLSILGGGKFTSYSATFIFSIGILISNFIWNSIAMYRPFSGATTSYTDYFVKGTIKLHLIGLLGGCIWCIGNSFSLIASDQAGFAISYGLGQGATMVAAGWGVFVWKEFRNAPSGTGKLINLMFISFVIGLILLILARY